MNETLFDELCKVDVLLSAWKLVKQKGTSGGIDGRTIEDVDADIGNVIRDIRQELMSRKWTPEPYLRISIPKKNSEIRQLGLLSIKDKIVQQAIKILADDDVGFQSRERKGATDLVNSMLNYGYSILYARVWQSLLYRQLNPSFGILHEPNQAKPTFAFDVIELFRAQAVDRVVISLVQKGEDLKIKNGLLSDETKKLLMQNLIERMHRYENYRDKESRLCDIINFQTKEIAEYIENGKTYRPYIAKW